MRLFTLGDHKLVFSFFVGQHVEGIVVVAIHLLEGFDNIVELRGEEKVSIWFMLFSEEEEQHKCLYFFSIFFSHFAHNSNKSLVLRSDSFVLLHKHFHHSL